MATGSNGIDQSLDYQLKIRIPAAEAKKRADAYLGQLLKRDISALTSETVVMDVLIGGTYKDPRITVSAAEVFKAAVDPLAEAATEAARKAAADKEAELSRQAQAELEKQKAELEKKKKEAEEKLKAKLKGLFPKK